MNKTKWEERLKKWIEKKGGLIQLKEATREAQEMIDYLEEQRKIDWKTLYEPFII